MSIPSRPEMRSILRQHLIDNEPATLKRWEDSGEADVIFDAQVDEAVRILKWNLGDDPYNHPDLNAQMTAWEYAKAHLLEYPKF